MRLFLLLFVVVDAAVLKRLRADPEEMVPSSQIHPLVCEHYAPYFGPEFTVLVRYLAESLGEPDLAVARIKQALPYSENNLQRVDIVDLALGKIKEALPYSEYNLERVEGLIVELFKFMAVTELVYRLLSENAHRPITELVPIIVARDAVDGASMRSESSAFMRLWIWRKYCLVVGVDCQYEGTKNIWRLKTPAMRAFFGDLAACPTSLSIGGLFLQNSSKAGSGLLPLETKGVRLDPDVRPQVDLLAAQKSQSFYTPEAQNAGPISFNTIMTTQSAALARNSDFSSPATDQTPLVPFNTIMTTQSAAIAGSSGLTMSSSASFETRGRLPKALDSKRGLTASWASLDVPSVKVCKYLTFPLASKEANVGFRQYLLTSIPGWRDAEICLEEMKEEDLRTSVTREEVDMMIKKFERISHITMVDYEILQGLTHRSEDEVLATMILMRYDFKLHDLYMSALYVWSKYCFGSEGSNCHLESGVWTIDRIVMQEFIKSLDSCNFQALDRHDTRSRDKE